MRRSPYPAVTRRCGVVGRPIPPPPVLRPADPAQWQCPSGRSTGDPCQEVDDRRREGVVLVTRHHVMSAADIDELGVWNEREELGRGLETQDVAAATTNEEDR